jgi:hypothetical protein
MSAGVVFFCVVIFGASIAAGFMFAGIMLR